MSREWKPGDVARGRRVGSDADENFLRLENTGSLRWLDSHQCAWADDELGGLRPVAVVDFEDREQVQRLVKLLADSLNWGPHNLQRDTYCEPLQAALREFANPKPLEEPTDPKARVEDRRDNVWRLLADGEWVCTSGPDIGEYLTWSGLLERGPLEVQS